MLNTSTHSKSRYQGCYPRFFIGVFDEGWATIRTGYGSENMIRIRRFVIGLIKSKAKKWVVK
ncbi:MAG: hypothetical protein V3U87_07630 [Methylococcaceae bacterium]